MSRIFTLAAIGGLALSSVAFPAVAAPSAAQQEQARANFRSADANGDEKLDKKEFEAFIRANADAGFSNAKKVVRFGAFDRAFAKKDTNQDGFVSAEELKSN